MIDADDDESDVVGPPGWRRRAAAVGVALIVVAAGAVVVTFLLALGGGRGGPDVGVVVVTDPVGRDEPTPVLVMAIGPDRVLPFSGRVNGVVIGEARTATVVRAATKGGVNVEGSVQTDRGSAPARLEVSLPGTPLATTLSVGRSPSTLAVPALGARVHPVAGLVPPRGPADVVLVDDQGVSIVRVDVAEDGRLPDGRLLAIDRRPLSARIRQGPEQVIVEVDARRATRALVTLSVGGRVRAIEALELVEGQRAEVVADDAGRDGDLIVASVSTAAVPGVAGESDLQLVDRRGGLAPDEPRLVEPGLDDEALRDERVREALARRLRVEDGSPDLVSPPLAVQRSLHLEEAAATAARARGRFRVAALVLWSMVLIVGGLGGARPGALALATLLVGGVLVGLDQAAASVVGAAELADGGATSGSP